MDRGRSLSGADGLRAIATWMVMFHHLSQELIFRPSIEAPDAVHNVALFFISAGSAGVSVFFVLSGFLLSMPFWNAYLDGNPLPSLKIYAMRRAGRIIPGYWLNLLFFFALGLIFFPHAPSVIWRYLTGLSFTAGFHWLTFFPAEINGPLWSISFEVFSYLLMPLGMIVAFRAFRGRRWGRAWLWWWVVEALVLAGQAALQLLPQGEAGRGFQYGLTGLAQFWMPRYNPLGMFGHFAFGILAAGLVARWNRRASSARRQTRFDFLSALVLIAWLAIIIGRTDRDQFSWNWAGQPYYFPLFAGVTALLLATLTQSGVMGRLFDNPVSRFTARVSFGLYLWHDGILQAFNGDLSDWGQWLILVVITVGLSYLVAHLSWTYWEKPFLDKAHAWRPRLRTPAERLQMLRRVALVLSAVVVVPAAATTLLRPEAWIFPTPSRFSTSFRDDAPALGVAAGPGMSVLVGRGGRELDLIDSSRLNTLIVSVEAPAATVRLVGSRPPWWWILPGREPSLSLTASRRDFLWNIATGPDGVIALAERNRVVELDREGHVIRSVDLPCEGDWGVAAVAYSPDGTLWAGDGGRLYRFIGSQAELMVSGSDLRAATSMAWSSDGRTLAVCDFGNGPDSPSALRLWSWNGDALAGSPSSHSLQGAFSVAASGNRWVVSSAFRNRLSVIEPDGRVRTLVCPWLRGNTTVAAGGPDRPPGTVLVAGWDGTVSEIDLDQGGVP